MDQYNQVAHRGDYCCVAAPEPWHSLDLRDAAAPQKSLRSNRLQPEKQQAGGALGHSGLRSSSNQRDSIISAGRLCSGKCSNSAKRAACPIHRLGPCRQRKRAFIRATGSRRFKATRPSMLRVSAYTQPPIPPEAAREHAEMIPSTPLQPQTRLHAWRSAVIIQANFHHNYQNALLSRAATLREDITSCNQFDSPLSRACCLRRGHLLMARWSRQKSTESRQKPMTTNALNSAGESNPRPVSTTGKLQAASSCTMTSFGQSQKA